MLEQTTSGAFTDLWTLGVILYEMACGVTPFQASNDQAMFNKILARDFSYPEQISDPNLRSLIDSLLQLNPKDRLGMKGHHELRDHPFFEGIDFLMLKK